MIYTWIIFCFVLLMTCLIYVTISTQDIVSESQRVGVPFIKIYVLDKLQDVRMDVLLIIIFTTAMNIFNETARQM